MLCADSRFRISCFHDETYNERPFKGGSGARQDFAHTPRITKLSEKFAIIQEAHRRQPWVDHVPTYRGEKRALGCQCPQASAVGVSRANLLAERSERYDAHRRQPWVHHVPTYSEEKRALGCQCPQASAVGASRSNLQRREASARMPMPTGVSRGCITFQPTAEKGALGCPQASAVGGSRSNLQRREGNARMPMPTGVSRGCFKFQPTAERRER